jgi:hypothetical protein
MKTSKFHRRADRDGRAQAEAGSPVGEIFHKLRVRE